MHNYLLRTSLFRRILSRVDHFRLGRKLLNFAAHPAGIYESFADAWVAVNSVRVQGHEHPEAWQLHTNIAKKLRSSDYSALYTLAQINPLDVRVFDFGGSVGNVYYLYRQYLKNHARTLSWVVFDLPKTLEEGRVLAAQRNSENLRFASSCAEYTSDHVLLVSGAFHYWESSVKEFFAQFGEKPRSVILNRLPVLKDSESFVTVQLGREFGFPCKVWNEQDLLNCFEKEGYVLRDSWREMERSLHLLFFPHRSVPYYSGYYFEVQR